MSVKVKQELSANQGWCFGNYDRNSQACSGATKDKECQISGLCSQKTNRVRSEDIDGNSEKLSGVHPEEYLISLLSGRFNTKAEEIDGGVYHYFRNDGHVAVIGVAMFKDGRIVMQSPSSVVEKPKGFKSTEEVEETLVGMGVSG